MQLRPVVDQTTLPLVSSASHCTHQGGTSAKLRAHHGLLFAAGVWWLPAVLTIDTRPQAHPQPQQTRLTLAETEGCLKALEAAG
jgi:hypothetical protein